ncbi:hypothetical protein HQ520_03410 [bacterium]|nr:hypothetical protein [bacterium]
MRVLGTMAVMLAAVWAAQAMAADPADIVYDIPRIENVTVDGDVSDWGDKGYAVKVLTPWQCKWPEPRDLDGQLTLAWDDAGLLVAVRVLDDVCDEADAPADMWKRDCLETDFGGKRDGTMRVLAVIAPGASDTQTELRTHVYDLRPEDRRQVPATVEAARTIIDGGYLVEARYPWNVIGVTAKKGSEATFQIHLSDTDADGEQRIKLVWYPDGATRPAPTVSASGTRPVTRFSLGRAVSTSSCGGCGRMWYVPPSSPARRSCCATGGK